MNNIAGGVGKYFENIELKIPLKMSVIGWVGEFRWKTNFIPKPYLYPKRSGPSSDPWPWVSKGNQRKSSTQPNVTYECSMDKCISQIILQVHILADLSKADLDEIILDLFSGAHTEESQIKIYNSRLTKMCTWGAIWDIWSIWSLPYQSVLIIYLYVKLVHHAKFRKKIDQIFPLTSELFQTAMLDSLEVIAGKNWPLFIFEYSKNL